MHCSKEIGGLNLLTSRPTQVSIPLKLEDDPILKISYNFLIYNGLNLSKSLKLKKTTQPL